MSAPKLKLIVAGNYSEYQAWLRDNGEQPTTARYVDDSHKIRGLRNCEVVRTGRYWTNPVHSDPYLDRVVME